MSEQIDKFAKVDQPDPRSRQTGRTKEKIRENVGLLMDFFRKKYGSVDDSVERILFNALDWTATDVQEQCEAATQQKQQGGYCRRIDCPVRMEKS